MCLYWKLYEFENFDLREVAEYVKGHRVHDDVRASSSPGRWQLLGKQKKRTQSRL